jgi:tetratricopeptide (TPR) repeat protein
MVWLDALPATTGLGGAGSFGVNSGDGESYVNLGHVLYNEGRYIKARVRLKEGLKRSPGFATGHFFLGSTELKLGDLGRAESNLKQACLLDPKGIPEAYLQLANVYLRARELAAAGTELGDYLRANPADPQAPDPQASRQRQGTEELRKTGQSVSVRSAKVRGSESHFPQRWGIAAVGCRIPGEGGRCATSLQSLSGAGRIESLHSQLELPRLPARDVLEERQVDILETGSFRRRLPS